MYLPVIVLALLGSAVFLVGLFFALRERRHERQHGRADEPYKGQIGQEAEALIKRLKA